MILPNPAQRTYPVIREVFPENFFLGLIIPVLANITDIYFHQQNLSCRKSFRNFKAYATYIENQPSSGAESYSATIFTVVIHMLSYPVNHTFFSGIFHILTKKCGRL